MLTQAEIDALLSGSLQADDVDSGGTINLAELIGKGSGSAPVDKPEANGKQVRPYNFWSPDRFSKEQIRAVELVHENLAERLTTSMPPYLRTDFRPRVVHLEQGRADDFLKELPAGTLFHILALDPLPGRMMIVLNSEVTWVMLDRLLGGAGKMEARHRVLTDIGQALMNGAVEYMLNDIKAAWSKVVAVLEPRLEDSTVNHHWVQMMMGNNRMLNVMFEVAMHGASGTMGIYIPFFMLKPIAALLNPHVWIAGQDDKQPNDASRDKMLSRLRNVPVPMRVELGCADLTLAEIMDLRPGDVIRLDSAAQQPLPVYVSGRVRFRARPGALGNRLAVQIESALDQKHSPEYFEVIND
jgi:flagellar motor switch protein FliM